MAIALQSASSPSAHVGAERLRGWKFGRQARVGRYGPDFVRHAARVIVEADGGKHAGGAEAGRRSRRRAQGFPILRFWNNDIFTNQEGVPSVILSAQLQPLPTEGEEA